MMRFASIQALIHRMGSRLSSRTPHGASIFELKGSTLAVFERLPRRFMAREEGAVAGVVR
jgi:hypothetical protein